MSDLVGNSEDGFLTSRLVSDVAAFHSMLKFGKPLNQNKLLYTYFIYSMIQYDTVT